VYYAEVAVARSNVNGEHVPEGANRLSKAVPLDRRRCPGRARRRAARTDHRVYRESLG
jgi:hypothetical protein